MSEIASKTIVGPKPTEYYGTLITSGIEYQDGSRVTVQKALYVKFLSPTYTNIDVNVLLNPWQGVTQDIGSKPVDDKSVEVTAKIGIAGPYTFNTSDTLTWDISGDLTGDASLYTGSFKLYADELPSGTVAIQVADVPNDALSGYKQTITLTKDSTPTSYSATPGETTEFKVITGQYTVEVDELVDTDETVVATASVSPTDVAVEEGATTTITVTYGAVQKYSALNITVGQLSPPLDREELPVQVAVDGGVHCVFNSANNHTTSLRRLPPSGTATVGFILTVNNAKYTSSQSAPLSNTLIGVAIGDNEIKSTDIDTSKFVTLPINVTSEADLPGESVTLRLASTGFTPFVYVTEVDVVNGTTTVGVPVAPGKYTVLAPGFINDGNAWATGVVDEIVVAADGSSELDLVFTRGPHLLVRGFPDYLGFGALSDLVDLEGKDLTAARVTAVFKYAGNDGGGDSGEWLSSDPATTKTVQLAALVSKNLGDQPVLPVMISYTVNLSGTDGDGPLKDTDGLAHSFGNLILSLRLAREASNEEISAGYIVNPDFLGENQKTNRGANYVMGVVEPLQAALDHHSIAVTIPDIVTDTLAGYAQAVNWLIRTVAPEATFGWQVNLWGVGTSAWIYNDEATSHSEYTEAPVVNAKATVNFIKSLGVYSGDYTPDFLAIDRYEADDFTVRAYGNGWCYGPNEWRRYYEFVKTVAFELKIPVIPWQIPASRIPNSSEAVGPETLERDHWGSGGTYIFGDPAIGADVSNISPAVLAIKPAALVQQGTVESLFRSSEPFDLSGPIYHNFPVYGIFAVLLGGGSTTGVVTSIGTTGAWTQEKISEYMEEPISLTATTTKK